MATLSAGDRVEIRSREITADDEKNGLYYSYFGGLTGTVDAVYPDGSVCIDVDLEALSQAARERHLAMQEAERKKWLDSLSGEARNRLTAEQKQLKLSYKILVGKNDVIPTKGGKPKGGKRRASPSPLLIPLMPRRPRPKAPRAHLSLRRTTNPLLPGASARMICRGLRRNTCGLFRTKLSAHVKEKRPGKAPGV